MSIFDMHEVFLSEVLSSLVYIVIQPSQTFFWAKNCTRHKMTTNLYILYGQIMYIFIHNLDLILL